MQTLSVFNAVMIPAAMITACSLLLLGVYDKYSKIVASLRALNAERRGLVRDHTEQTNLEDTPRLRQIEEECGLLKRRLGYSLRQMQTISTATILFLTASLLLAAEAALHLETSKIAAGLICLGFIALVFAMAQALIEAKMIWQIVDAETSEHAFRSTSAGD